MTKVSNLNNLSSKSKLLKSYLERLNNGEVLESVRADFQKNFQEVDAREIMQAEQELIASGTPINKLQQLCDIHSALFHGHTTLERAVQANTKLSNKLPENNIITERKDPTELINTPGHPLQTLTRENDAITSFINELQRKIAAKEDLGSNPTLLKDIAIHYAKKGDLLYPHLSVAYGVTGPSNVMWTVDDEIRDEISRLAKAQERTESWMDRFQKVLQRAIEMIYKETNILYPLTATYFSPQDWYNIYQDAKDFDNVLGVIPELWPEAEANYTEPIIMDGEVQMPGGTMTIAQLTAMLNVIPLEITFVDAADINRYFNEGPKDFKRPQMALGREVFTCHPPKIQPMVHNIIKSFKEGTKNEVAIWMKKADRTKLVKYMAVRDRQGKYLGTMEIVQDMEFAKEYFSK